MPLFKVENKNPYSNILQNRFIVPPFSVLDTRQGYWLDRRRMWLQHTEDLTQTRNGDSKNGDFGRAFNIQKEGLEKRTSTRDPVFIEIMYKWFSRGDRLKILDPFGGDQAEGFVAGVLGHIYYGSELRQEQVDLNTEKTKDFPDVHYIQGDSCYIDENIEDRDFTFLLTSPPYYNLEQYSDGKKDISAVRTYNQFMKKMETIFSKCYKMLYNDTFAVIKIGEIRNEKTGDYYGFVPDCIDMMRRMGWKYYNEIILINSVGSAGMRADGNMKSRKIVKLHQNILVFYKGDTRYVASSFEQI